MALQLKPTDKILHNYQLTLREFRHASIEHESATRSAFQTLLAELARRRKWQLIPEHPYKLAPGATIRLAQYSETRDCSARHTCGRHDSAMAGRSMMAP